jgi:hypothetical protein
MTLDLSQVHHTCVFVVHVKEVDLVRQEIAIKAAFLYDYRIETI